MAAHPTAQLKIHVVARPAPNTAELTYNSIFEGLRLLFQMFITASGPQWSRSTACYPGPVCGQNLESRFAA